jgi:hypothetical protein
MNQKHAESLAKLGQGIMPLIMIGKRLGFTREELTERLHHSADEAMSDTGAEPEIANLAKQVTDIAIDYAYSTEEESNAILQRTYRQMLDAGQSPNQIEAQIRMGGSITGADEGTLALMQKLLREEVNRGQI